MLDSDLTLIFLALSSVFTICKLVYSNQAKILVRISSSVEGQNLLLSLRWKSDPQKHDSTMWETIMISFSCGAVILHGMMCKIQDIHLNLATVIDITLV